MRECLDKLELYARINHDKPKDYHDTIKECLAKLTEGEK